MRYLEVFSIYSFNGCSKLKYWNKMWSLGGVKKMRIVLMKSSKNSLKQQDQEYFSRNLNSSEKKIEWTILQIFREEEEGEEGEDNN